MSMDESYQLDPSRIRWVETTSGGRVKVRDARLVRLDYGGVSAAESALKIDLHGGGTCLVPTRAVVRVDVDDN